MRRLTILLLALGLLLAACGGSGEDTTTTASEDTTSTTTAADTTTTTRAAETTTTAADTTSTTAEQATGTDDCLVGTWVLDTNSFVDNFGDIFEDSGMPDAEVTALDGSFTVELAADGTLTGSRESWGFQIGTSEGTFIVEINGTETGTWSADGSTLSVSIDSSDLSVSSRVESGGTEVELPQGQFPVETPPGIATNSQYDCSGDVLTLTNAGVESVLNRS